jgi:hypothetical protein
MKLKITTPDIISKKDFKKTEIDKLFTNKRDQEVAFVKKCHAIVISEDADSKDQGETP